MVIQFGPGEFFGGLPPWRVELPKKMAKVRTIDFILGRLDHAYARRSWRQNDACLTSLVYQPLDPATDSSLTSCLHEATLCLDEL